MIDNYKTCSHQNFEYACISKSQLLCEKCYRNHSSTCSSSRCGNLKKLSQSFAKNIQILKLKQIMVNFGFDKTRIQNNLNIFQSLTLKFTNYLMKSFQFQIPFIIYSKITQLFSTLFDQYETSQKIINYQKQIFFIQDNKTGIKNNPEQHSKQLIKIVKLIQQSEKEKNEQVKKNRSKDPTKQEKEKLAKIQKEYIMHLEKQMDIKAYFYEKLKSNLSEINKIISNNSQNYMDYKLLENFQDNDFNPKKSIRYGINHQINNFNTTDSSDCLLYFCKNVLKEKVYNQFIKERNYGFPYKNLYLISTTSLPNPELQNLILKLEVKKTDHILKKTDSSSSFKPLRTLTKRILIMGPELIDISIINQKPYYSAISIKIFCDKSIYKPQRQQFIKDYLSILGCGQSNNSKVPFLDKGKVQMTFENQIDRIYCYFKIASDIMEENQQAFNKLSGVQLITDGKSKVKKILDNVELFVK